MIHRPKKYKIVVAGPGGVGKTSLLHRFQKNVFIESIQTIGVAFIIKKMEIRGQQITLIIWDYAGEQKFKHTFPDHCSGASGGVFCFEAAFPRIYDTLNDLIEWIEIFRQKNEKPTPILLVGTKIDLLPEVKRDAVNNIAKEFCDNLELIGPFLTSAKTGEGINEVFQILAEIIVSETLGTRDELN